MFSFCCYPTAGNKKSSLRNQLYFSTQPNFSSLSTDNLPTKWSSEKSSESATLSDWSLDKKLTQQILYPEIVDNINTGHHRRATRQVKPLAKNSSSKSSSKSNSSTCPPNGAHLLGVKNDTTYISSISLFSVTTITYVPVPMTKVLPNMYIGSYENAMEEKVLKANGITHILSLIGRNWPSDLVKQKNISMHDLGRTNLKGVLEKVSKFMELGQEEESKILVHCHSGQNRSATVVIAHLMTYHNETLYRAHKRVKRLRPVVQINAGYAKQLLALEKEIFNRNTLPSDWMERKEVNMATGEVTYKHENMNSLQHRVMFDSDE